MPNKCLNPECTNTVNGRTNKLFCSSICKTRYHNHNRKIVEVSNNFIGEDIKKAKQNLEELFAHKDKIPIAELLNSGIDPCILLHPKLCKLLFANETFYLTKLKN
jgi:hypothetical protein